MNSISTLDKILDMNFNELYYIDSIARGVNEMLLNCWKL